MNKMLQVRNLKPETHRKVKVRAAEEGVSATEWVTRLIERELKRPSMAELYARLKSREPVHLSPSAADIIREQRDSR